MPHLYSLDGGELVLCSSGFGSKYMNADDREKREHAVKDIRALLDWVEKQEHLDPDLELMKSASFGPSVCHYVRVCP